MISYPLSINTTPVNSAFYELSVAGDSPITLAAAKSFLKVTATADDDLITSIIDAVLLYAESYTGREFRANTWIAYFDYFFDRIRLHRFPVDTITSVEHEVDDSDVAVDSDVYYLKRQPSAYYIIKNTDKDWPSDTDDREQAVKITLVTKADEKTSMAVNAMLRQIAFMYRNRGDCGAGKSAADASGATALYNCLRIPRV